MEELSFKVDIVCKVRVRIPAVKERGIFRVEGGHACDMDQMKWCRDPRWSPRVRPVCHGNFEVAPRVPNTLSHFKMERGNSLEML